ncbi:MAG: carbohydrate kinase family protein, partial [Caldilineaceae bacterium]
RPRAEAMRRGEALLEADWLHEVSGRLLSMGAGIVLLKLGDKGAYLRTSTDPARIAGLGAAAPVAVASWTGRELYSPCFQVQVAGTTGSGDATVAGLLAALLKGATPEEALTAAVAVGAHSVEAPDATSGITPWATVQTRVAGSWAQHEPALDVAEWSRMGRCWARS